MADNVSENCVGFDQCWSLSLKLIPPSLSLFLLRPDDPGLETVGHSQSLLDLLTQFLSLCSCLLKV